jgi:hypothetical protein
MSEEFLKEMRRIAPSHAPPLPHSLIPALRVSKLTLSGMWRSEVIEPHDTFRGASLKFYNLSSNMNAISDLFSVGLIDQKSCSAFQIYSVHSD